MRTLLIPGFVILIISMFGCGKDSPTEPVTPASTQVNITNLSPASPAVLKHYQTASNDRVSVTYNYFVKEQSGVRIWIKPVMNNTGNIYYSPSAVFTGSGSKTVTITADSNEDTILVHQLQILIKNPDQSDTISISYTDVNYTFTK